MLAEYEEWDRRYQKEERALSPMARNLLPQIRKFLKLEDEAVPIVARLARELRERKEARSIPNRILGLHAKAA